MDLISCLLINVIIVFIWNYFDAPQSMANGVIKILSKGKLSHCELKKPFGCPLCMTFWSTLLFLLLTITPTFFNILLAFVISLVNAYLNRYIYTLLQILDKWLAKLLGWLYGK